MYHNRSKFNNERWSYRDQRRTTDRPWYNNGYNNYNGYYKQNESPYKKSYEYDANKGYRGGNYKGYSDRIQYYEKGTNENIVKRDKGHNQVIYVVKDLNYDSKLT